MATAVLMIDDDESLSAMLAEYLAPMDFDVTAAATVAEGMTRLADGGFDLMILDVMLPDGVASGLSSVGQIATCRS